MQRLLRLLKPPEWDWWSIRDRIAYFISLGCALGLMGLGANVVREWIIARLAG